MPNDPLNILLIDDDLDTLNVLRLGLHKAGHKVYTANSWEQTEARIEENDHKFNPFDLVILDLMMPDKNGFEVYELLRDRLYPMPKVFILTAQNHKGIAAQAAELGAANFFVKPISILRLNSAIEELIRPDLVK
jgi:DNA-binding response OmpR family regulator